MQSSASSNNNNFARTGENRQDTSVQALKTGMSSVFNGLSTALEVNNSIVPLNGTNEKFTTETDGYDSLYERSDMAPPHPSSSSTSSAYVPRSPSPSQENQPLLSRR